MPRSHCCLLIPTTRRSRHNRCWRPIGPHKPGLSSHSEHPFTSSSHLPDFHPLFFLISQFYFHFSFCLLPFTRSLLWFLTLFSTWHSSSLKQVPSSPSNRSLLAVLSYFSLPLFLPFTESEYCFIFFLAWHLTFSR